MYVDPIPEDPPELWRRRDRAAAGGCPRRAGSAAWLWLGVAMVVAGAIAGACAFAG